MRQTHQQLTPAMQRSTPDTTKLSQLQLRPTHTQNRSPNLPYRINAEKVFPRNQQNKPSAFKGTTQESKTTQTTTLYSIRTTTNKNHYVHHNSTELTRSTARTPRYNQNNNSRA